MKFIMCLKPALKRIRHLLRNSKHVRDQLASLRIPEGAKFIKVDIKDYYLSGEHSEFIRAATQCVDPEWQVLFQAILSHLLDNQYIKDDAKSQRTACIYKVILGAGMGIAYAGDLCDATFWFLAERQFADNKNVLDKFSIYAYFRFRDDILIIAGGTSVSRQRFLRILRQKASFWVLKIESVSSDGCSFLDLAISRSISDSQKLQVGIFTKPTELHRPLCISSYHPCNVHIAWPRGMSYRARVLTSNSYLLRCEERRLHNLFAARFGSWYAESILQYEPKSRITKPSAASSFIIFDYCRHWN